MKDWSDWRKMGFTSWWDARIAGSECSMSMTQLTLNLRTSPSSTEVAGKKPAPRMAAAESVGTFDAEELEDEEEEEEEEDMASKAGGTSSLSAFLDFFAPPLALDGSVSIASAMG